ncbi:MAG: glycosyltransferase family 4 protein, partial [Chthoniobacterales bacterium]
CHLFGSNWIAKPIVALSGGRVIYHHDQCNDSFRAGSPLATLVDAWTNQLSTRVLAVSRSVERFAVDIEGVDPGRVSYLPNSVDLTEFRPASGDERAAARREFGLPEDGLVVGGVGRFVFQKNFDLLIAAMGLVLAEREDVWLVLFGSGPDEAALKERVNDLGEFGKRVVFAGTVRDRRAIFAALDLLVLPSRFEGLPLTVLEAMASGVPVVATAVDGMREIVAEMPGVARLVAPGDEVGLRGAIAGLIGDAGARERLAGAALPMVRERFDAEKLARELEQLYEADCSE